MIIYSKANLTMTQCKQMRGNECIIITLQRLDIRGRVKILLGQNRKSEEGAPLALFAVCTPFGPPSLLELPQKEVMYKSKHKLDLSMVSMDQR